MKIVVDLEDLKKVGQLFKDKKFGTAEAALATMILSSDSVDFVRRHAFEAGREGTNEAPCGYEYPTFKDYNDSLNK